MLMSFASQSNPFPSSETTVPNSRAAILERRAWRADMVWPHLDDVRTIDLRLSHRV
jgi:hypothetical protein